MKTIAQVEGGIRIGNRVFLGQSDITTATNRVSLKSKWSVSLPWWWLSNLRERTEPWSPIALKPFWTIGWSHTRAGFMRSSFTNRERDDGSINGHHNLWVIHLCDLAYLFPFMFREQQDELAARLNKNDQQRWQMDFISADMMQSKLERADKEAVEAMQPKKWMGMPICSRLDIPWRSISTWHSYDLQLPRYRRHPNPRTQEDTLNLRFQRRWMNDLLRSGEEGGTSTVQDDSSQRVVVESISNPQPRQRVDKRQRFSKRPRQGGSPEFL